MAIELVALNFVNYNINCCVWRKYSVYTNCIDTQRDGYDKELFFALQSCVTDSVIKWTERD